MVGGRGDRFASDSTHATRLVACDYYYTIYYVVVRMERGVEIPRG